MTNTLISILIVMLALCVLRVCERIFCAAVRFTITTYFKALAKHDKEKQ